MEAAIADADADKEFLMQAVIVRIMKMRKKITHTELVIEFVRQLHTRFKPNIGKIKECISTLIDKEYIKREEGCSYSYLA